MRDDDARITDRRMALAREWDDLVERVRQIEGFEDFLRPPPLAVLLEAAQGGPVIIVNVSKWRCDALVVSTDGVRPVPLPHLSADEVNERTANYLQLLQDKPATGAPSPDPKPSFAERLRVRAAGRQRREEMLHATMEWLWDTVAEPVLTGLGIDGPPTADEPLPRVWWCPTGMLTMLPLHGAGYHAAADGRSVLDRVISSYTPTLRALRESLKAHDDAAGDAALVFVGVPDVPDQVYLGGEVAREKAAVTAAFSGGLTVIEGADATTDTVVAAMAEHRWIHLSCHGYQDIFDPSRAGLMLTDGTLTIPRISARRFSGEFAFLSACMTATGGVNLPDEAITLAAALSYTGYRHVVATLWKVHPAIAAQVTETIYPQLTPNGTFEPARSAVALHHAVRALRDSGRRMSDWLPFTHNGP
jgi:CHAT domain